MKHQLKIIGISVSFFMGQNFISAQDKDTLKTQNIEGVVVTALVQSSV